MKRILAVSAILLFTSLGAFAQRYFTKVFDSVTVGHNFQYGLSYDYKGDSTILILDTYRPFGDTFQGKVPLVVLAHDGFFLQGNKASTAMITLCKELAMRGYTVSSISYRLGLAIDSSTTLANEFAKAAWRATLDMRAAIRFFRKHIAEGNNLHLDSNNFYAGGISSGGIMALHLAFLDTYSEFNTVGLDTAVVGDMEGKSGNPGYSWRVKGVIGLSSALSNVSWMNNNKNVSLCFMHGDHDQTIPYKSDYYKIFGQNVAFLYGGFSADSAAAKQVMDSRLYTFKGADHTPFIGNAAYMDTTAKYIAAYLYKHVTGLIPQQVAEPTAHSNAFHVYPNPASGTVNIQWENANQGAYKIELMDLYGKVLLDKTLDENNTSLDLANMVQGIYIIRVANQNQTCIQRLLIN